MFQITIVSVQESLSSCIPPVPAISKAKHVISGYAHNHTHIYSTHTWPTDTLSTHTNASSTNGLMLFPSLADKDKGPLVGNTYIYRYWGYVARFW